MKSSTCSGASVTYFWNFASRSNSCSLMLTGEPSSTCLLTGDSTISLIISFMETGELTKFFFTGDSFGSGFVTVQASFHNVSHHPSMILNPQGKLGYLVYSLINFTISSLLAGDADLSEEDVDRLGFSMKSSTGFRASVADL
ncbi:hypothetical protein Leryth_017868 [Lithospermum erythrorhizon]|nr:hypothetical protein Leryth_017868 [Lithospermum erythrorhizon]